MKFKVPEKVTACMSKLKFKFNEHSPEIFLIGGIVTGAVGVVLACKATLKATDEVKEQREKIQEIKDRAIINEEEAVIKKEVTHEYGVTVAKMLKTYAIPASMLSLSLTCFLVSNNILKKRNVALAAAYTTIDNGFKAYRKRVIDRFGEDVDKELRTNTKEEKYTTTEVDPETGEEKTVEKTRIVPVQSDYARIFDETNPFYKKDANLNRMMILSQQNTANDLLKIRGYLFLNEVYEMLGFGKTAEGQVVGWLYRPDDKKHSEVHDNYVDFGIWGAEDKDKKAFLEGKERSVWIDFNVDGVIYNKNFAMYEDLG